MNNSAPLEDVPQNYRRSANYKPNIWKYDFLQSLHNKHGWEENSRRMTTLVEDVKQMLEEAVSLQAKFELIDSIKKMGLASVFEKEIEEALERVALIELKEEKEDLHTTALCLRLLRQNGHKVSQDVLRSFKDKKGGFIGALPIDPKAVIELMEASHLRVQDEITLEKANTYSTDLLEKICSSVVNSNGRDSDRAVRHALELPLHRRVEWFDARWQILAHERNNMRDVKSSLVELAKLHFNAVQAIHQKELKELSRWWRDLGLVEHLNFTRDRLVESFLCAVGLAHEPQYSTFRKSLTKVILFILVIDDLYDLYGSLEELHCFTTSIDRWNFKEMQHLPECMKLCFQALDDVTNEIAFEIGSEEGWIQLLPHLQKLWSDFCKSLLVEAKWFGFGYKPSLEEYLENAWVSSSGPLILTHAVFFLAHGSVDKAEDLLKSHKDLIYNSSLIIRLCNDLATSEAEKDRGDAPSSILCYTREEDVSEEEAMEHIEGLIIEAWKNINKASIVPQHSQSNRSLIRVGSNAARVAHMLYQYGDGFGVQDDDIRRQILNSLMKPLA